MIASRCALALSLCAVAPIAFLAITSPAAAKVRTVQVGPIWNQQDAQQKCTAAAQQAGGTWTGQWRTTRPGQMSECDIRTDHDRERIKSVEVGPIWNQMDANQKCPAAAQREGGQWTGQWRTIRPGMMSVCDVSTHRGMDIRIGGGSSISGTYNGGGSPADWHGKRSIGVGPIWNQIDAQRKCPEAARKENGTWTGDWRTTGRGQSECDIRR
jgi:hypothetical protein